MERAQCLRSGLESFRGADMPEDVISDRCADCGHPSTDHDADGCKKCDCSDFVKPLQSGNRSMARSADLRDKHIPKE